MDEKEKAAKEKLNAAILEYARETQPDSMSGHEWVLVFSHESAELMADDGTAGTICAMPYGQPFWHTMGLLMSGLDTQRAGEYT